MVHRHSMIGEVIPGLLRLLVEMVAEVLEVILLAIPVINGILQIGLLGLPV